MQAASHVQTLSVETYVTEAVSTQMWMFVVCQSLLRHLLGGERVPDQKADPPLQGFVRLARRPMLGATPDPGPAVPRDVAVGQYPQALSAAVVAPVGVQLGG